MHGNIQIIRGTPGPGGGQYILSGRTGFSRKMCPRTHCPGRQIFSDTGNCYLVKMATSQITTQSLFLSKLTYVAMNMWDYYEDGFGMNYALKIANATGK